MLLKASARFIVGSIYIIDATFNINEARMPIIIAVGVPGNEKAFLITFSYYKAEDHESYSFFWESLKEH